MTTEVNPKAYPLADSELQATLIKLVGKAVEVKLLKKGANEVTKTLQRSKAQLVILAAGKKNNFFFHHLTQIQLLTDKIFDLI